jgi:hypothetical protein
MLLQDNYLTRLSAREELTEYCRRETGRTSIKSVVCKKNFTGKVFIENFIFHHIHIAVLFELIFTSRHIHDISNNSTRDGFAGKAAALSVLCVYILRTHNGIMFNCMCKSTKGRFSSKGKVFQM